MEIDAQIETLRELGFQFRNRSEISNVLGIHDWWQYTDPPYLMLMERICAWAHCKQSRICTNVVSWDYKGLRHTGWFKSLALELAELSSQSTQFRILQTTDDERDDVWKMEYRITSKLTGSVRREVTTRFPHKYASWSPTFDIANDFTTATHCFVNFSKDEPVLCWLSKESVSKLQKILPVPCKPVSELVGP